MRLFIVGYMGAGKTTIGKKLSKKLNLPFFDLDQIIENESGRTINSIFSESGESAFRKTESESLRKISGLDNFVLATGGGTPCFNDNMDFMKSRGRTIYIEANCSFLVNRLSNSKSVRPLIFGMSESELESFIKNHLAQREKFYKMAHYIISAVQPRTDLLAELIMNENQ